MTGIAITGLGLVTPIGVGPRPFWEELLAGRCGIAPVRSLDTRLYGIHHGAEVDGLPPADCTRDREPEPIGRASQLAVAAACLASRDADLDSSYSRSERTGVAVGTTWGEPREIEDLVESRRRDASLEVGQNFVGRYPYNVLAANVARHLRMTGRVVSFAGACAAGNYALAYAIDVIRSGRADVMLAGGAESFSSTAFAGFARLGAIAPEVCQPFDRDRRGLIPGEGAAFLVLEPVRRALDRGARIYAELFGYGLSCDAHHMTAPHPDGRGAVAAMAMALENSGVKAEAISYISAHGTGTVANDRIETIAIKQVFGKHAWNVPISSIKASVGHAMGAASAIEAAVCALAVLHDRVPPTLHLWHPDPECDLDYVAGQARSHRVTVAMNNAYGFGGYNASVILGKSRAGS